MGSIDFNKLMHDVVVGYCKNEAEKGNFSPSCQAIFSQEAQKTAAELSKALADRLKASNEEIRKNSQQLQQIEGKRINPQNLR